MSKTVDLVVDGDNKETYIDYDIDTWIVDDDKEFSMTFNYPIQQTSIKKDITISDCNIYSGMISAYACSERDSPSRIPIR